MKFSTKIYAVFDCNVLIQATANNKGSASACFRLVEEKVVKLFISRETLAELEDVLNRDYVKKQLKYTDEVIQTFLEKLRTIAEIYNKVPKVFSLPRDVDDEAYINLAVESESDYIVTRDKDLLYLMDGYDDTSKEFRQRFRPLKTVRPEEFLRIVEEKFKEDMAVEP